MRLEFIEHLTELAEEDSRIRLLTADMGFGLMDVFKNEHPERFHNVGCAEQNMVGIAMGMASCGLLPFCYSISSFLIMRPFEFIRHAAYQNLSIRLVGSGRNKEYGNEGFTHWAIEDTRLIDLLPNSRVYQPDSVREARSNLTHSYNLPGVIYYNLKRA